MATSLLKHTVIDKDKNKYNGDAATFPWFDQLYRQYAAKQSRGADMLSNMTVIESYFSTFLMVNGAVQLESTLPRGLRRTSDRPTLSAPTLP